MEQSQDILSKARNGDKKAFEELIFKEEQKLLNYMNSNKFGGEF